MNWCKHIGHKWKPVYVKGFYGNLLIKFVGCYCKRCRFGYNDLLITIRKQTTRVYGTSNEQYCLEDK